MDVTAYVLRDDFVGSPEGQAFGAFPGVWHPGEPQRPEAFGLSEDEFAALVETHGVPLEATTVHVADDEPIVAASTADVVSRPSELLPTDRSSVPGLTVAELAERDAFDETHKADAIPQTFSTEEEAPAAASLPVDATDPAASPEDAQRAGLEALTVAQLQELAPDGVDVPSGPKPAIIDVLVAHGVHAPEEAGS